MKIPSERLNPKGGAIALGHPLGCTGTLFLYLRRQTNSHSFTIIEKNRSQKRSHINVHWNRHGSCCFNRKRMIHRLNHMKLIIIYNTDYSKTFSMDKARSSIIILLLCDKHWVKVTQWSKDRSSHPCRELSLWRIKHINFHSRRSQCDNLLMDSLFQNYIR